MIKFSVPTNWRDDLLDLLDKNFVDELYGKLDHDFIGGGRPSFMLTKISRAAFERYIKKINKRGIKFNYLLNSTCIGNRELTIWGQRKLKNLLGWIVNNNVYAVTVSIPYLLEFIKYHYPNLKVYVSTMAGIDSLQRAKYWESLGADRITLSAVSNVMRNFMLLRKIKESIKCELQLIANLTCLYECPFSAYHSVLHSHASQSYHCSQGFLIDYCFLRCNYMKLKDPVNFIRSGWIRPEDMHYYENIGIERIKFANRDMDTESITRLLTAYSNRFYEGNLLDLFSDKSKRERAEKYAYNFVNKLRYFFKPFSVNIFKLLKLRKLLDDSCIYVDNRALDNFLEYFIQEDCSLKSCQSCDYCQQVAKKAIKIDETKRSIATNKYYSSLDDIKSGKMFTYINKREN